MFTSKQRNEQLKIKVNLIIETVPFLFSIKFNMFKL